MTDFKHIVRIGNTDLDGHKNVLYAMRKIKGVSTMFANAALGLADVDKDILAGNLSDDEAERLNSIVESPVENGVPSWLVNRRRDYETGEDKHLLGPDLVYQVKQDIKRMSKTKSYRGLRHQWGLTVRGQRTRSNFRDKGTGSLGVRRSQLGDDE
jgi:small subunit ribosomal protein S13